MIQHCAVIIEAFNTTRQLDKTLDSVLAQSCSCRLDILITVSDQQGVEDAIHRLLAESPWSLHTRVVATASGGFDPGVLGITDAEALMILSTGDVLFPGAVEKLCRGLGAGSSQVVFAACRWGDRRFSWSHPSVDDYFSQAALITITGVTALERFRSTALALLGREILERGEAGQNVKATLVKDYIGERFFSGKRLYRRLYPVRKTAARLRHARPQPVFPLHKPVLKRESGVWLIGERRGYAAEDNGWVLFRHCQERETGVDCYFVIHPDAGLSLPDRYRERVLLIGTREWAEALTHASHIFFTDTAADVLGDNTAVFDYADRNFIYLTHGVLAYSPGVYQSSLGYVDRVVCTSEKDIQAASESWGFSPAKFICTGLPRFDRLKKPVAASREILFCPTWRKSLDSSDWHRSDGVGRNSQTAFAESAYFKATASFLKSTELDRVLREFDLRITVRLHFRFLNFLNQYQALETDHIRIARPDEGGRTLDAALQDCAVLITDYSSILWDMAYMEKPVICFQFDKPAMLAERKRDHFCLSDDELVADVCYRHADVTACLQRLAESGFELSQEQCRKLDEFMPNRTGGHCAALVHAINGCEQQPFSGEELQLQRGLEIHPLRQFLASRAASSNIAAICVRDCLQGLGQVQLLDPDAWSMELEQGSFDELVIEPFLTADDPWGRLFFDLPTARKLLQDAVNGARQRSVEVTICWPATLPYDSSEFGLRGVGFFDPGRGIEGPVNTAVDVSVVIPVFNGERHIARCLDSVLNQNFNGQIEIVVIDDGSTDGTSPILDQYHGKHANLVVIRQENARQGVARNRGVISSRGDYVTFVDADDILPPNAVAELWHAARLEKADIAVGLVASWQEGSQAQRINQAYFHYSKAPSVVSSRTWPHVFYDPSCVGKLYRRDFLLQNRLFFPQSFHEDQAFCFKLWSVAARCAVAKSVVYLYVARTNDSQPSGTQTFSLVKLRQMLRVGVYCSQLVNSAKLGAITRDHAIGFLLLRYDRFLWKRAQADCSEFSAEEWQEISRSLVLIMQHVSDRVIYENCRYNCIAFVCLKHGMMDLALGALRGEEMATLGFVHEAGLIDQDTLARIQSGDIWKGGRDYYRAVTIGKARDSGDLVTDMSYGYRLGAIFVDSYKRPSSVILAPGKFIVLLFDMMTGRGRTKQRDAEQRMKSESMQTLVAHSNFVRATAGYKLGVAMMEAVTGGPSKMIRLPRQVVSIFRETAPRQ